jgi:hypothetical protein
VLICPASNGSKSKHVPSAVVVLGRDTSDTGHVTLVRAGGGGMGLLGGSRARDALEKRSSILQCTCAHSRPHALENRQIYQTKGIESSCIGLGCLDDAVAKREKGPASCSWTPALCTMQRPSRRVTMRRLEGTGRATSRVVPQSSLPTAGFRGAGQCDCVPNANTQNCLRCLASAPAKCVFRSIGTRMEGKWDARPGHSKARG